MGLTRSWFNENKKIFIWIGCVTALLVAGFFIRRGSINDEDIGDDIGAEIRMSITNLEQSARDQRAALDLIGEQFERIETDLGRIESIEVGIESITNISGTIETLVGGLLAGEQRDRDLIIESGILIDRNQRLINSIREETYSGAGSSD